MARERPRPPSWFDLAKYREVEELDAAEWLLNLCFREWVLRTGDRWGIRVLCGTCPVLRRGDSGRIQAFQLHFYRAIHTDPNAIPTGVLELLTGRQLDSGILPLTVEELYMFEARLPEPVRETARRTMAAQMRASTKADLSTMRERMDHAFSEPALGRFVRINLALPDSVLIEDLKEFLRGERASLERYGLDMPYRKAVSAAKKFRPGLDTFAKQQVLPYLDLQLWCNSIRPRPSTADLGVLLGVARNLMPRTLQYADRALDELFLWAWLGPRARQIHKSLNRQR